MLNLHTLRIQPFLKHPMVLAHQAPTLVINAIVRNILIEFENQTCFLVIT